MIPMLPMRSLMTLCGSLQPQDYIVVFGPRWEGIEGAG